MDYIHDALNVISALYQCTKTFRPTIPQVRKSEIGGLLICARIDTSKYYLADSNRDNRT